MTSIVAKFGGSSVKHAEAMYRCGNIIENNSDINLVILSATYNTTNELEFLASAATLDFNDAKKILNKLSLKHQKIGMDLDVDKITHSFLKELFFEAEGLAKRIAESGTIELEVMDQLYSVGERASSCLFSHYLRNRFEYVREVHYFDVRKVLKTDDKFGRAIPMQGELEKNVKEYLLPFLREGALVVTQGFVGTTLDGRTTTLGREGSDYSATLLAEAIEASSVEIWTDVAGVYDFDPRYCSKAQPLPNLSYDQAASMAKAGAKVLFPETLKPAQRKNIPVYVKSTLDLDKPGTVISQQGIEDKPFIAIATNKFGKEMEVSLVAAKPFSETAFNANPIIRSLAGDQHSWVFHCQGERTLSWTVPKEEMINLAAILHSYL